MAEEGKNMGRGENKGLTTLW